jgi:hypothetical protein
MTVYLVAVDYSRPIRPMFEQVSRIGTIHSVFNKAMNIALDGTLLALLSAELPHMPNSVRLPSSVTKELLPNLRPGMEVRIGDDRLHIRAHNFSLRLPDTPAWEPRPDLSTYSWCRETVAQHVCLLAQFVADKPQPGGLTSLVRPLLLGQQLQETPLSRMAMPKLRLLAQASWRQNIAGIEEAVRGLAGLGPGLTPSGDDVLVGFAAIMALLSPQLSADSLPREHIASIIAAVAKPRTTILSAVLLEYASRGEVAEQLGMLMLTLSYPVEATETLLVAADRVLAFGASSGGDTLLGILLGLRTLEGEID